VLVSENVWYKIIGIEDIKRELKKPILYSQKLYTNRKNKNILVVYGKVTIA
jgi:hypothetical protein